MERPSLYWIRVQVANFQCQRHNKPYESISNHINLVLVITDYNSNGPLGSLTSRNSCMCNGIDGLVQERCNSSALAADELWNLCMFKWTYLGSKIHYEVKCPKHLTYLPMDKMAALSEMAFSNAFSWIKHFIFPFKFHWSLFLRVQLTKSQHSFR